MNLDPELLAILRCPQTGEPLTLSDDGKWLVAAKAGLRYPIVEGIPRLVAAAAEKVGGGATVKTD